MKMQAKRKRIHLLSAVLLIFVIMLEPGIYRNHGSSAWGQKKPAKKTKKPGKKRIRKFALNFNNVDIHEFINIMSQLIGKNIILDDKVRGKISISSAKRVPVTQAYEIMKSILEVKGLAVVETENLIKVIPISDAIRKNVEIIIDGKKTELKSTKEKTITFLLELKNADAVEISNTLKTLKSKFTTIVVHKTLNTIIFSGSANEIEGLIKITRALDKKVDEEDEEIVSKGNIHVVHLENADSDQLADVLSRIPFSETAKINTSPIRRNTPASRKSKRARQPVRRQPQKSKTKLSIISNKETNSLVITAKPEEFKQIKRLIKELDIVREQVLIEALIVEIGADNGWGFGIDWMLGNQTGNHIYGGSSIMGNSFPDYSSSGSDSVLGKTLALPLSSGFQLGYLSDTSILGFALLNASSTKSNINILSTPQILTIDNQEAELNVGEEVPVITNTRITENDTQLSTWDYKSVGLKLKITPHITKSNRITLDLYQEVNSVLGDISETSTKPPKLGKRDIKTKVTVFDGKTIVVGGLIRNNKTVTVTKVPLLGDIPLLGWFFKHQSVSYTKTNLLVFITPHIVTKEEKLEKITRQKRRGQMMLKNQ
jgi:general secretion pathway protein D